jgi:uncharacterized protein
MITQLQKIPKLLLPIVIVYGIAFGWSLVSELIPFVMGFFGVVGDTTDIPRSFNLLFLYGEAIGIIGMAIYYRGDRLILPFPRRHAIRDYALGLVFRFAHVQHHLVHHQYARRLSSFRSL